MNIAELVSELLFAGKPLAEIAGYDDRQLRWVIGRDRDKYGRLKRRQAGLPSWVEMDENGQRVVSRPTAFAAMFRQVYRGRGKSEEEVKAEWTRYQAEHPRLGRGGE